MGISIGTALLITSVLSAGASVYSTTKQVSAAKKARKDQKEAIAKATTEAKAERERIENLDRERLERLRKKGAQLPPSMMTGMSGVTGAPTTLKQILG